MTFLLCLQFAFELCLAIPDVHALLFLLFYILFFQKLREAIQKTQKNVIFQLVEDTPYGNATYLLYSVFDQFIICW